MKRSLALTFVLALAVAAPAAATSITYSAILNGSSESPANASPATGLAIVTVDDVANTMRVQLTFAGLLDVSTASHIHVINGPGDANLADTLGPVATTTPAFAGFPLGVMAGTMDQTYDMALAGSYRAGFITDAGGTIDLARAALFDGIADGRAYLNVHSRAFPGGEIRGFLAPVPEPGALVLLGTAALGAAGRLRRRPSR